MHPIRLALFFAAFLSCWAAQSVVTPGPESVPEWAQQGRFRFTRFDGGPIQVRKTTRSARLKHFNEQQKEVLANLYTKYGDRMADLLVEAHINWVWITWSVGFSEADEAEQRAQCKTITDKLHKRGIKVAAYMCAVTVFWESMFRDDPRSVRWIKFDPEGTPFRYSGGRDALRFIADLSNPDWLECQKKRVGGIIDAGLDAIFFDNTGSPDWTTKEDLESFFAGLRRYIHEEKKSNIVLFTNYGLHPEALPLNHNMEFVFNEGWREPGAWGEDWEASNVRRLRYVRGVIPAWKPHTSEYSIFRTGTRATTWLSPRSQKLGILEAAAFQSAYCWDMEGPFDGALMAGDAAALASWKAIAESNGFLKQNEALYAGARGVAPVAVLMSASSPAGATGSFSWAKENTALYDLLSKKSVPYHIRLLSAVTEDDLKQYRGLVIPETTALSPADEEMLGRFKSGGGKVLTLKAAAPPDIPEKLRALAGGGPWLEVEGAPHVLGTLTSLDGGKRLAVHLVNYDQQAVAGVRVKIRFGGEFRHLADAEPRLRTPDAQTRGPEEISRTGTGVEFTLPRLDTYGVVVFSR